LSFYHPQQRHHRSRHGPRPVAPAADGAGVNHGQTRKGRLGIAQIGKGGAELVRGHGFAPESTAQKVRQTFHLPCAKPSFQGKAGQLYARKNRKWFLLS
jgi:hypothetical protein